MTVTVLPVGPAHPAFAEVVAMFDEYRGHYGQASRPGPTRAWLADQLTQGRLTLAAARHGDEFCGFVTTAVLPASLRLGTVWWIRDLYVAPNHRRGGVGRTLLRHVVAGARAAGALRVSLQTESDNVPALTLYAAAGFRPVAGLDLLNLALRPNDRDDPTA